MLDPVMSPAAWNNTHSDPNISNQLTATTSASSSVFPATFKSTGKTPLELDSARRDIVQRIKAVSNFTVETGIVGAPVPAATIGAIGSAEVGNPYPIVILVSGAGGNGKDTFIDAVGKHCSAYNLSSITEIKEIAEVLVEYTADIQDEMPVCPSKHMEDKSDRYRQFLHALKMAWSDFCDGPTYRLLSELKAILTDQSLGGERYDVVFLHVREAAEIDKIRHIITNQYGIICLTMIVKGLVDASAYANACDSNVDNYSYDLTIMNTPGQQTMFELQAKLFADNLIVGNRVNGIESSKVPNVVIATDKAYPSIPTDVLSTVATSEHNNAERTVTTKSSFRFDLDNPDAP